MESRKKGKSSLFDLGPGVLIIYTHIACTYAHTNTQTHTHTYTHTHTTHVHTTHTKAQTERINTANYIRVVL